jgi:hypothetical protein
MARRSKLTDADWRQVFQLRCKSKRGEALTSQESALVERAYEEDEARYGSMEPDVFNATVPFGSGARWGSASRKSKS